MRYLRWTMLALMLCFAAMAGAAVEAAASPPGAAGKTLLKKKELKEKTAKKTAVLKTQKAKPFAKSGKAAKAKKSKQALGAKVKKSGGDKTGKRSSVKPTANSRRVWMERVRSGDGLLGKASWYGSDFHGGPTASGEPYDMYSFTAAHRTLPMGTVVEVTDETTGRAVMVCINNRGPYKHRRIIDLSYAAAQDLGIENRGVAEVNLRVVSDSQGRPLNNEEAFYVRLDREGNARKDKVGPFAQFADASVMQDVLRIQYPNASVVLGPAVASR